MASSDESAKRDPHTGGVTRRNVLSGGALLLTGAGGFGVSEYLDERQERSAEYPYWAPYWEVTRFEMESKWDDIKVILGLRNLRDHERVWPGSIWAASSEVPEWIEEAPMTTVQGGENRVVERWLDAQAGHYKGGILGLDSPQAEVTVDGA